MNYIAMFEDALSRNLQLPSSGTRRSLVAVVPGLASYACSTIIADCELLSIVKTRPRPSEAQFYSTCRSVLCAAQYLNYSLKYPHRRCPRRILLNYTSYSQKASSNPTPFKFHPTLTLHTPGFNLLVLVLPLLANLIGGVVMLPSTQPPLPMVGGVGCALNRLRSPPTFLLIEGVGVICKSVSMQLNYRKGGTAFSWGSGWGT
eukprot:768177-Hanusia_phi.AAC.8